MSINHKQGAQMTRKRKRFESGQLVIPTDLLGKTFSELDDDEHITSMARPFFQGIDNEFELTNTEAVNLKELIKLYGSKHTDELSKVEKYVFNAARAKLTVNIYNGLERILFRICGEVDEQFPLDTMASKRDALERLSMEMPVPGPLGRRPAVISAETKEVLNELMKFRRAQQGCYTAQLVHLDLAGNAEKVIGIVGVVKAEVDRFKIELAKLDYPSGE